MDAAMHDRLATLLTYPGGDGKRRILEALHAIAVEDPATAEVLEPFQQRVHDTDAIDLEELYTRTFDINPVCTLEVGWHLYGEDYSRGAFLVKMRQTMRQVGVEETSELPDHLTHTLAVAGRMPVAEAARFVREHVLPAVLKMLAGFEDARDDYRCVLDAVRSYLTAHYGEAAEIGPVVPQPYGSTDPCGGCGFAAPPAATGGE